MYSKNSLFATFCVSSFLFILRNYKPDEQTVFSCLFSVVTKNPLKSEKHWRQLASKFAIDFLSSCVKPRWTELFKRIDHTYQNSLFRVLTGSLSTQCLWTSVPQSRCRKREQLRAWSSVLYRILHDKPERYTMCNQGNLVVSNTINGQAVQLMIYLLAFVIFVTYDIASSPFANNNDSLFSTEI